jgi:NTE family protein
VKSDAPKSLRVPTAGVFGGGGLFGIGYALGVLEGLRRQGLDLADSPMLGTSAGSWAASALALDVSVDKLIGLDVPRFPNPRKGVLATAARQVFGNATHPNISVVACSLPRLRRTVLHGADHPLADLVAASSAVPGLLAPHTIGGVRYVDGGVRSGASIDFAASADLLVIIAPLAGAMFGPFGGLAERALDRETAAWKAAHKGQILEFFPREVTAGIARRPDQLFDKKRAIRAYECGLDQVLTNHRRAA